MIIFIFIFFLILSFWASRRVKSKMRKYSKVALSSRLSGREIAAQMLIDHGITNVRITSTPGQLTDHYNPMDRTVNLSEAVYHGQSVASASVAAHECGHAVQHAQAYSLLQLRSALVPLQNISARLLNIIFMVMFFGAFALPQMISFDLALVVIVACYGVFTAFSFITLPVEFDASKRALVWIKRKGITSAAEQTMAADALQAAAMTYVVAALSALATLLYYLTLFLGGRD